MKKKNITKQATYNNLVKTTSFLFSFFFIVVFLILIIFMLVYAIKGFQNFGIINILFSANFNPNKNEYSFWIPFSITILTSLIAICIATPLGIRVSLFTKYRLHEKYRKIVLIFFQVLSGIPSVIFGLFAQKSLGLVWQKLFGIDPNSLFNASLMLTFMIIPTIVTLTLDSLNNIDKALIDNPLALGNTKTRAIYKIAKKAAKPGIIVAIILAISRALGESMAVSMILQAQPSTDVFKIGFIGFLDSSYQTLGAFISTAMFSDTDPEKVRPLLYAFGFILLIVSMFLNMCVLVFSRKRNKKNNSKFAKFEIKLYEILSWAPRQLKLFVENVFFRWKNKAKITTNESIHEYIELRNKKYKLINLYHYWKLIWELLFSFICFSFVIWISGDIIFNGIIGIKSDTGLFFEYSKNSTFQSFVNTLLIILLCLAIGFPLALIIAIYLNEYSTESKTKKMILFFLDLLGTTPSILFGMFGLLLFIQTFGWSSNGIYGNSLIAGILTLIIVIIPTFTRLLEQALKNVPKEIRTNSYALGNTKLQTIWKLVLPMAITSITTSIVSIIGRVLSETAPLYLTAGLSSSSYSMLNRPGTTLTTQIYAQLFSVSSNSTNIQYQAAFMTMIFVLLLILIGYLVIPNWKNIKNWFLLTIENLKSSKRKERR